MSERTEIVKTCDVCGKRVSDEGVNYHEMPLRQLDNLQHPFNDWFKVVRTDSKRSKWDLCSDGCFMRLLQTLASEGRKETLL